MQPVERPALFEPDGRGQPVLVQELHQAAGATAIVQPRRRRADDAEAVDLLQDAAPLEATHGPVRVGRLVHVVRQRVGPASPVVVLVVDRAVVEPRVGDEGEPAGRALADLEVTPCQRPVPRPRRPRVPRADAALRRCRVQQGFVLRLGLRPVGALRPLRWTGGRHATKTSPGAGMDGARRSRARDSSGVPGACRDGALPALQRRRRRSSWRRSRFVGRPVDGSRTNAWALPARGAEVGGCGR